MKNCSTCEERHPGCEQTCEECGTHFPPTEEMMSDDTKENRRNLFFLVAVAVCMIAFVILCGTLLNYVTGGRVQEKTQVQQEETVTAEAL